MQIKSLLVIDDEPIIRKLVKNFFEDHYFHVLEAENGQKGIDLIKSNPPDIVIVDLVMPELDGFSVITYLHENYPDIPVIVVSGIGNIKDPIKAMKLGAWDYLFKPIEDLRALLMAVEKCLERAKLIYENKQYQDHLEQMVTSRTAELEDAYESIRLNEKRYRTIFENFQDVYFETTLDGMITELSPSVFNIFNIERSELIGKNMVAFYFNPKERDNMISIIKHNKFITDYEVLLKNTDGEIVYCSITGKLITDHTGKTNKMAGTIRDITLRKNAEERIKKQLEEKEVLIQEIHHRVKNNMQIINSLIFMQADLIEDPSVKASLKQIESRILSMALVHNQLYQSDDLSQIGIKTYIDELTQNILISFGSDIEYISDCINTGITIEIAIPIGLVINEIVTNSVKHAFSPECLNKKIQISAKVTDQNELILEISDNGDLPANKAEHLQFDTLGSTLIRSLIKQMNGTYSIDNNNGMKYTIRVKS